MSGREWAPGTVAVATVRGESGVRVVKSATPIAPVHYWFSVEPIGGFFGHTRGDVTDVRPLVVLDTDDFYNEADRDRDLPRTLRLIANADGDTYRALIVKRVADAIEAQTRPPKPPEPTGLGAVVKDSNGRTFVRTERARDALWIESNTAQNSWVWDYIDAVEVLSEGVAP